MVEFIATSAPWNPMLDPIPTEYDNHAYYSTGWFAENAFWYDPVEVHMHPIVSYSTWKLMWEKAQWHLLL